MNRQRGFTLVELMVALAVFAITATVILKQSSQSVRLQKTLEDTSFATWIAQNQLAELRNSPFGPRPGEEELQLTFVDRQWQVQLLTEHSQHRGIYRVQVTVSAKDEQRPVQISLTGYIAEASP